MRFLGENNNWRKHDVRLISTIVDLSQQKNMVYLLRFFSLIYIYQQVMIIDTNSVLCYTIAIQGEKLLCT